MKLTTSMRLHQQRGKENPQEKLDDKRNSRLTKRFSPSPIKRQHNCRIN